MPTYQDDYLFSDSGAAPPASPLLEQPGIGMAPAAPAQQPSLQSEAISQMGTGEKIFSALGEFGSGVTGRGSPLNQRIRMEREEKTRKLAEFKVKTDAIEDSVKWASKLQGTDRTNFVNVRVQQLNEQSPGLGDQFKVFSEKPDLVGKFREYAQHLPEPHQLLLESNPDGFLKFASTPEGLKVLSDAKDKSTLRLATKKAQTAVMAWDRLAPPDVVSRFKQDGIITASEFLEAQQYVPEAARLSEGEVEVAMRTPGFWQALNIAGPGEEAEARKARLKDPAPKTRTVTRGTKEVTEEYRNGKWEVVGTGEKFKPADPDADRRRDRDVELKLADDYARDTKGFKDLKAQFSATTEYVNKVTSDSKKITPAGDRALVFAYAKMLDPGDKVAVKDVQDIEKLAGVPDRIIQGVKAIVGGKTLADDVRSDMYQEIKSRFGQLNKQQRDVEKDYTDRAGRYKLDARNVVRKMSVADEAPKVGDVVTRGGKQYKVVKLDKDGEPLVEEVKR